MRLLYIYMVVLSIFGVTTKMICALIICVLIYTGILYFFKGSWWYDTIYAYAAGACFAWWKDKVEFAIKKYYRSLFIISLLGFVIFYNADMPKYFGIVANITALFMCMIMVLFSYKIKIESKVLEWSGSHLFPLYIYQRIPMLALSVMAGGTFMAEHYYLYIVVSIIVTVFIALLYKYINISHLRNSLTS